MQIFVVIFFSHVMFILLTCLPVKPESWHKGLLCHCIVLSPSHGWRRGETTHSCKVPLPFGITHQSNNEINKILRWCCAKTEILLLLRTWFQENSALTQKKAWKMVSSRWMLPFLVSFLVTETEWKYFDLFGLMQSDERLVCERWFFFFQCGKGNSTRFVTECHLRAWKRFLPSETKMHYPIL